MFEIEPEIFSSDALVERQRRIVIDAEFSRLSALRGSYPQSVEDSLDMIRREVADLYKENENLRLQQRTDGLTGLPNRQAIEELSSLSISLFSRQFNGNSVISEPRITFLGLDLNNFKSVNDNYGHDIGDNVLRSVGKVLIKSAPRSTDMIARVGGDEFLGYFAPDTGAELDVLKDYNLKRAQTIADDIDTALQSDLPSEIIEHTGVGISVGVAMVSLAGVDVDPYITIHNGRVEADKAMYMAKQLKSENSRSNVVMKSEDLSDISQ